MADETTTLKCTCPNTCILHNSTTGRWETFEHMPYMPMVSMPMPTGVRFVPHESPPAQSDAPSAEEFFSRSIETGGYKGWTSELDKLTSIGKEQLIGFAEAYAALRTAQADAELEGAANAIKTLNELIASQAAKVAQLEREIAEERAKNI